MIYYINMQSLTQTNVFLTPVLLTHLQDTNVLVCLNLESCRCDASPANNQNKATFVTMRTILLNIAWNDILFQCNMTSYDGP